MRKIMLVIDDFNDLLAFETFFRRIGFDVLSLGKDLLVSDALLSFTPDLVIATAKGRAVDGLKLASRLKKHNPPPRTALSYPAGSPPTLSGDASGAVDALIEVPSQPRVVLTIVAQLTGLDADALIEKFEKLAAAKPQPETKRIFVESKKGDDKIDGQGGQTGAAAKADSVHVTGKVGVAEEASKVGGWDPVKTPGTSAIVRSARSDRYDKFLTDHSSDDVSGVLPHAEHVAAMKKLKAAAEADKEELEKLDEAKRQFAKALFIEAASKSPSKAKK